MKLRLRSCVWLAVHSLALGRVCSQIPEMQSVLTSEPVVAVLPLAGKLYVMQPSQLAVWNRTAPPESLVTQAGVGGANRLAWPGGGVLGGFFLNATGKPMEFPGLVGADLVGVCRHPEERRLCFLTEDGKLLGADLGTKEVAAIFDNLPKALGIGPGRPRMRALFAAHDRLYVANDLDPAQASAGLRGSGRLAEWDWRGAWRVIESSPFVDIAGAEGTNGERSDLVFALGYDDLSLVLRMWHRNQWKRYRLPWRERPAGQTGNRIREISTDRWLMQAFGNFYQLQAPAPGITSPRVKPLCSSSEPILDFCAWRGAIILAGGQNDRLTGSAQPLLKETFLESLVNGAKPSGKGAVWRNATVGAGTVSDSFLIDGFDKKTVHFSNESDQPMQFDIDVDVTGTDVYRVLYRMEVPGRGYIPYVFPQGYSATWVRVKSLSPGAVTAEISME
jgi:hypothetical protein